MSEEKNVGGALLRVLGSATRDTNTPSPASMADAFLLIDSVLTSQDFRARCAMLSKLVEEVDESARKNSLRALIILMQSAKGPLVEASRKSDGKIDYDNFRPMTPEYTSLCAPLPRSRWADHVEAKYRNNASAEMVRVSPYLAEMIAALELLFAVPGSLLTR